MFSGFTDSFRLKKDINDTRQSERPAQTTGWSPLEPPGYASRREEQRQRFEQAERERLHALEERERLHALREQRWRHPYQDTASTSQDRAQELVLQDRASHLKPKFTHDQASGQISRYPDDKAIIQLLRSIPKRQQERADLRSIRARDEAMNRQILAMEVEADPNKRRILEEEQNRMMIERKRALENYRKKIIAEQKGINNNQDYYEVKKSLISEAITIIANKQNQKAVARDGALRNLYDKDSDFKGLVDEMAEKWRRDQDNWVSTSYGKENIAAAFMALWIMHKEVGSSARKEELRAIIKKQRSIVQENAAASLRQVRYIDPAQPSGSGTYYTTTRNHRVSFQQNEAPVEE